MYDFARHLKRNSLVEKWDRIKRLDDSVEALARPMERSNLQKSKSGGLEPLSNSLYQAVNYRHGTISSMFELSKRIFQRPAPKLTEGDGIDVDGSTEGSVSVVIPLYNHERFIDETLASVLSQGVTLREVIVVDDGSRDRSLEKAQSAAEGDRRLVVWSQPNQGAHAAINNGIARATGEFVAVLNSDDLFERGRLETLVGMLRGSPSSELAASGLSFIDSQSREIADPWYEAAVANYRANANLALALVEGNFLMTTSNFLFRRSLVQRIGGFRDLRYAHDLDFLLRILAHGGEIAVSEKPLVRYRRHDSNTISEQHSKVRVEWAVAAAIHLYEITSISFPSFDVEKLMAFEKVFERHQLAKAVHLVLMRMRVCPPGQDAAVAVLRDRPFLDQIQQAV